MASKLFPHFSHRISARLFFALEIILLWSGLAALIAINVISLQKDRPAHWDKFVILLWSRGYKQEAQSVLGATTDLVQTLAQWEQEAQQLKEKYAFWQTVAAAKPDYRDALITLAATAYQLGNKDDARGWLAKAQALDPNSPAIEELAKLMR